MHAKMFPVQDLPQGDAPCIKKGGTGKYPAYALRINHQWIVSSGPPFIRVTSEILKCFMVNKKMEKLVNFIIIVVFCRTHSAIIVDI